MKFIQTVSIFAVAFILLVFGVYLGNKLSQPRTEGWQYMVDDTGTPTFSGTNRFKDAENYAASIKAVSDLGWELVGFIQAQDGSHAIYRIRDADAAKQADKIREKWKSFITIPDSAPAATN